MSAPSSTAKLSPLGRAALWFAGALAVYTVVGVFLVPAIARSRLLKRLPVWTHRQAAIAATRLNPYTFAFGISGIVLTETNGDAFASCDTLSGQLRPFSSLWHRAWIFHNITLTHPVASLVRRKDGSFNFDNLRPADINSASTNLAPIRVETLRLTNGLVSLTDLALPAPFHQTLGPVDLQVTELSTLPGGGSRYSLTTLSDTGGNAAASGTLALQPIQSSGHIHMAALDLKRYAPYLADFLRAPILSGTVEAAADYNLGADLILSHATLEFSGVRLQAPDSAETVLTIPSLSVDLARASLGQKNARLNSIKSSGGSVILRRRRDGTLNLADLLNATPSAPAMESRPWSAQIDDIAFDKYSVHFEDQTPATPVKMEWHDLAFDIKNASLPAQPPISFETSLRCLPTGSLSAKGSASLNPLASDIEFTVASLDLPPLESYFASQIRLNLTSGQLNMRGRARYSAESGRANATFLGDAALNNLHTVDLAYRDFVKFDALAITGIKLQTQPADLQIARVKVTGFSGTLVLNSNREPNYLSLLPKTPGAPAHSPSSGSAQIPVSLGALVLDNASIHVSDQSIQPSVTFNISELSGTVSNLSSHPQGPAQVDLRGAVDQFSPFSIQGNVDSQGKNLALNLALVCKNIELTSFTPYMERYGGYPLDKGKLMLQLHYDVTRRRLTGANKLTIDDLTLGVRNHSPEATTLPVKLGIDLLKDRHGDISLDIPLSGSLDDPKFALGPIVKKAVHDLLLRVAKSPFTFLGAVLGEKGGKVGEELSYLQFAPGSAAIEPGQRAKLQQLSKALYERPNLTLQITGAIDPAGDAAGLARLRLERDLKALRAEELAAAGTNTANIDAIQLQPAERARLVEVLFLRKFGTNQTSSVISNAPAPSPAIQSLIAEITPPPVKQDQVKGGELMMQHGGPSPEAEPQLAALSPPSPAINSTNASSPGEQPVMNTADLEKHLLDTIPISDNDLRTLMQDRARAVRDALLEPGQIPPDRIYVLAPPPVDRSAQGAARAIFALE